MVARGRGFDPRRLHERTNQPTMPSDMPGGQVSPNRLWPLLIIQWRGGRDRATQEPVTRSHAWPVEPKQLSSGEPRNSGVNWRPWGGAAELGDPPPSPRPAPRTREESEVRAKGRRLDVVDVLAAITAIVAWLGWFQIAP